MLIEESLQNLKDAIETNLSAYYEIALSSSKAKSVRWIAKMKQSSKMGFLFFIASILSLLAFAFNPLIIFKVLEPNDIEVLWFVGWIFWVVGMALIILPYYHIYYRKAKVLVDSGIYAVVRHPLYLGWILSIFVATIFLHQHWLFVIIGVLGIASLHLISRQEDHFNIERFGNDYKRYMQKVPRMNLLLGVIRLLRRRKTE